MHIEQLQSWERSQKQRKTFMYLIQQLVRLSQILFSIVYAREVVVRMKGKR